MILLSSLRRMWSLVLATFFYLLATMLLFIVMPGKIEHMYEKHSSGGSHHHHHHHHHHHGSGGGDSEGALMYGILDGSNLAVQFLFLPLLGVLSDRFGRKPILAAGCVGLSIWLITAALATSKSLLYLVFIGGFIEGATGGYFAAAQSFIADTFGSAERSDAFSTFYIFGQGPTMLIGSIMGALMVYFRADMNIMLYIGAGLAGLDFFFVLFLVKESLARHMRKQINWKRANSIGSLLLLIRTDFISGFAFLRVCMEFALSCVKTVTYFYIHYRYDAGTFEYSICLGVFSGMSILATITVPSLVSKVGERKLVVSGLVFGMCGFVICSVAWDIWMFYFGVAIAALAVYTKPTYLSVISKNATPQMQGELQTGVEALGLASKTAGTFALSALFSLSISDKFSVKMPWLVYVLCAIVLFCGILLALFMFRRYDKEEIRMVQGNDDVLVEAEEEYPLVINSIETQ